jgi:hypothetical protein
LAIRRNQGEFEMSQAHMDTLLDAGVRHAIHLLENNREFYPFGIARCTDGEISLVYPDMAEDRPASDRVIKRIVRGLIEGVQDGRYTATGVVSDVRLSDRETGQTKDAIRLDLEDCEAQPVIAYLPYSMERDQVTPGRIIAEPGSGAVFRRASERDG